LKGLFALVDCNNFYVSCERVFNPRLEGRPVVVLSSNDGVIIARSEEAKKLGIPMGEPLFRCARSVKKHGVLTFSANFSLYGDMSRRVMEILSQEATDMEIYSIDEAFLILEPGSEKALAMGRLKKRILSWCGIPVSIGIAPTKTLAKTAARIAKKTTEGVFDLSAVADRDKFLGTIPIQEIWGIGRQSAGLLERNGLKTALEFTQAPGSWVKKKMGVTGLRIQMELQGVSCLSLEEVRPSRKSVVCSRSFGRPVRTLEEMHEAVAAFVSRAAEKLREEESAASSLTVFIATSLFDRASFYSNSSTAALRVPSAYTPELAFQAKKCLERIFRAGLPYKKAGILLDGLLPQDRTQLDLVVSPEVEERRLKLMKAVDRLNREYGPGTLRLASEGRERLWRPRREKKSPGYTTSWDELPLARA
jgi:DNA polymerase V